MRQPALKWLMTVASLGLGACAALAPPDVAVPATAGGATVAVPAAPAASSAGLAPAAPPDAAAAPAEVTTQALLEGTRRGARSSAEWLARGVDSWFGPQPFEHGGKVSNGLLSIAVLKRQDQKADVDLRFTAHFHLPNARRHSYFFFGRDSPSDAVRDTPLTLAQQQRLRASDRGERSFLAGFGLALQDAVDFRIGLGPGVKPYLRARYDKAWEPAPGQTIEFRETLFLTRADRFGSSTALAYELDLSPSLALRWLNAATITERSRALEWSSSLGAYKSLGGERLLSLEAVVNGTASGGTGPGLSDRGLVLKWEQPIHENWLLMEVLGGHFWPRGQNTATRGRVWAAGSSLKMRF